VCDAAPVKDWVAWHQDYDDPASSLARRLVVVQARLARVLEAQPGARPRLLSLCAGDARDVVSVLSSRPSWTAIPAVLVERDAALAERAAAAVAGAGLEQTEVRCADAGVPGSFADVLPVDVLLLCGIFGNIDHASVEDVVRMVPTLLTATGTVIWTRGGRAPDRRPEIRRWFEAAGLAERSFDGEPDGFGVGVNQLVVAAGDAPRPLPDRLFTFR
jgi:hypothetical protein